MTTPKDTGGAAFPSESSPGNLWNTKGMSLRDYFAAKAMQGYAASVSHIVDPNWAHMAGDAYRLADAMLEARK